MLEIPEAVTISKQMKDSIGGKIIKNVVADFSHHKFAWYYKDPNNYNDLLKGKKIEQINSFGGMIEINAKNAVILLSEGLRIQYHNNDEYPKKHQLLIQFEDSSAISAVVQMYGGLWCFEAGQFDNIYYKVAKEKRSPLSEEFDKNYFNTLISSKETQKLSAKAFLATQQRIPGLGNGVLQDILFNAGIHPKKKIGTLTETEIEKLFLSVKDTLKQMVLEGGRDTEKDLFGLSGGYKTKMSKNTWKEKCSRCNSTIQKASYLGGTIYYCDVCQKL